MTRRDTQLVQGTDVALGSAVPLTAPIYNTTTFVFPNARELVAYNEGRSRTYLYSRYENPTVVAVEGTLAALDRAERGLLFSSGMAAVATLLMAHLRSGDEIICAAAVYGGTRRFLSDALAGFGVHVRYASLDELGRVDALVTDRTKVVWFETPVNPTLRCVDVSRLARACRSSGALSVIDNTFASPINQQPLPMGVDLVVQSVTKYLNGHSDVMGGVVTGSEHLLRPIEQMRRLFGTVLGPQAAAALGRGLKTLSIRVCRQNASAGQVASCLDGDRRVARVFYPGLPSHPDHEIARQQMTGFGGMVCFDMGDYSRAEQVFDRLTLIKRAASLGGVESLVSMPVLTSHWRQSEKELADAGVTAGMLRLSVGLEDPADLMADLDQALA
ncbi:MAG: cystathionine gamma-synthase [Acidobacteria bacterium]|nr:MAG: cystathionine gamma-synthase [Acidobacteriota bacterium]